MLITGAGGQVGRELVQCAPSDIEVCALDRGALDITDVDAVSARVANEKPDVILNAAAYTAVDRAESEPDAAFAVNGAGPRHLAMAAARAGARLVHISTDFVFDGNASAPYGPADTPGPLSVYGESKLAGERAVQDVLGEAALIVRISWVYSAHGRNFVRTM
ncbi:MAG: SDR family oxidoreductase, partial [Rhodothalassiaceae bacterium]